MEKDIALEKTRYLLNSSSERKNHIEDFIGSSNERWDVLEKHKYNILEFSKFLTFKRIASWPEVTPAVIKSFIILRQDQDADFNLGDQVNSMTILFNFLIKKGIVQDNPFLKDDIFPKDDVEVSLAPIRVCLRCGIELESKIAKYCQKCVILKRKEYTSRWNKEHRKQLRESGRKWRERNPDKIKKYQLRYRIKNKIKEAELKKIEIRSSQKLITTMSTWCKELRKDSAHLSWMIKHKGRTKNIAKIENKFNCAWEDKFKEIFENYKRKDAARILNLDYSTLLVWAKHLTLNQKDTYRQKTFELNKEKTHLENNKHKFGKKRSSAKILLTKIDPTINVEVLNLNENSIAQVLSGISSFLSKQELFVIENRYLNGNFQKKKTLEELGSKLGLTRERIRQIEVKAINKLRHPSKSKFIKEKLVSVIFKGQESLESSLTKNKIDELQIELNKLRQRLGAKENINTIDKPIQELELSVRASNCLRKLGIKTLNELANKDKLKMLRVRNLGKKTLFELRRILHSFGLSFRNDNLLIDSPDSNKKKTFKNRSKRLRKTRKTYCLFLGCNVVSQKGNYCSIHKTAWHRKRALELLSEKKK